MRRAIKAAMGAGLRPGEFEVRATASGVRVITFFSAKPPPAGEGDNPWHSIDL